MLNTHNYDGKLNSDLLPQLASISLLSLDDKRILANEFLVTAKKICSPTALKYLTGIISDIGHQHNYDPTNNLNADDLIVLCGEHRSNRDFMMVLSLQLEDMRTGFCPQGRTHRLFQTLLAFNRVG